MTADPSSSILSSNKLHIFLRLFDWWMPQESDTESVLWWCSGCLCEYTWCILSMIVLHHVHDSLRALSTMLSFWQKITKKTAHYLEDLLTLKQRIYCCKFPWANWRFIDLIIKQRSLRSSGFLCDLQLHTIESILRLWITASNDSWFGSQSLTVRIPNILIRWCCCCGIPLCCGTITWELFSCMLSK